MIDVDDSKPSVPIRLGILDVAALYPGVTPAEVLEQTWRLAPRLEELGYSRFWFAEHHSPTVAHSCPEILVAMVASRTAKMRIGTAGILLRLHSPLRVAKVFRTLSVLYPHRIDLGIARGRAEKAIEVLLRDGAEAEVQFESKVEEFLKLLKGTADVAVNPASSSLPEVWILGSNVRSMAIAAEQGAAFCFARFLPRGGANTRETIASYRKDFKPSFDLPQPACSIALAGICAESDEEARALLPANPTMAVFPNIVGGPSTWRRELRQLQQDTGVNEFIVLDLCESFSARLRSHQLLAEALAIKKTDGLNDQP